jgi:hypothetical protein
MSSKIAQRQVVGFVEPETVGGIAPPSFGVQREGYFAQVSGGEITASVEKVYDGGSIFPETLCAPPEIGDITLTRHYDKDRDGRALQLLRPLVGRAYYDVTVQELDCDLVVYGTQRSYAMALLVGLSEPEGDSSSGAPTTFSLTFSISSVSGVTRP